MGYVWGKLLLRQGFLLALRSHTFSYFSPILHKDSTVKSLVLQRASNSWKVATQKSERCGRHMTRSDGSMKVGCTSIFADTQSVAYRKLLALLGKVILTLVHVFFFLNRITYVLFLLDKYRAQTAVISGMLIKLTNGKLREMYAVR
jgi:hypothetical protein